MSARGPYRKRDKTPSAYGVELRRLRTRKGHSQSQDKLKEDSGVSKVQIYNIESGETQVPHVDTHKALADALDLDEDERARFDAIFDELDRERNRPRGLLTHFPPGESGYLGAFEMVGKVLGLIGTAVFIAWSVVRLTQIVVPPVTHPPEAVTPHLPTLHLNGALVEASPAGDGRSVLLAMNPRTGGMHQLLPDPLDTSAQNEAWIAPAYSPVLHELTAIRIDPQGIRSLWDMTLQFATDGTLVLVPQSLRELEADCGICNTLTISPSGHDVIYETANGLQAINPTTGAVRQVTFGTDDAWPACAPNGQWLAYQHDVKHAGVLGLAPAQDCLPTGPAHLMAGTGIAWHPAFSPDSQLLAFNSTPGGSGQQHYRVFLLSLGAVKASTALTLPAVSAASDPGCADPTWASETADPHSVLIYTCGTHVMAASGDLHQQWHEQLGGASDLGPALYNPTWVPRTTPTS